MSSVPVGIAYLDGPRLRASLLAAADWIDAGREELNRINVFLVAYQPPYAVKSYFPSFGEIAVTVGLIATLMLVYRALVTYLPVISHPELTARKA